MVDYVGYAKQNCDAPIENIAEEILLQWDDDSIKKNIGCRFIQYRQEWLSGNRAEFIRILDSKYSTIINIERGKSYPKFDVLIKLTNISQFPLYYFTMGQYNISLDYKYKELIGKCEEEQQIKILMKVQCEKYHMFDRYREEMVERMMRKKQELDYELVGYLLQFERCKKGKSLKQLARNLGCTPKHIQNIESGNTNFSVKTMLHICWYLQVPMDYFLVGCLKNKKDVIDYLLMDLFNNTTQREAEYYKKLIEAYGFGSQNTVFYKR